MKNLERDYRYAREGKHQVVLAIGSIADAEADLAIAGLDQLAKEADDLWNKLILLREKIAEETCAMRKEIATNIKHKKLNEKIEQGNL